MTAGLPLNTSIGPYRIIDYVGAGGMGAVYRVSHRATGQVAAAKVLNGNSLSPRSLDRFRNEARILQAMSHPGIAAMYDFVDVHGSPCLVMEYVDGETVEQMLRTRGVFAIDEAVRTFTALVDAVSYVHQRGVVHRDLKTNNVKIDSRGCVKLLDFGIAISDGAPRLTSTGNVVGTLLSLAPEQLRTGRGEYRSDIWALGVLFYEMLTARAPFGGGAPAFIGEHILSGRYDPISELRPDVPPRIERIVARCLKVRPEDRYPSAEALLAELHQYALGGAAPAPAPLERLRVSGEVARKLAREWRIALGATFTLAALGFFVWSFGGSSTGESSSDTAAVVKPETLKKGTDSVSGTRHELLAPAADPFASSGVPDVSRGTLIIRVLEGTADVYVNDMLVGRTPYTLKAPLGVEFQLRLRQAGCDDLQRVLRLDESMRETIESLQHCRTP